MTVLFSTRQTSLKELPSLAETAVRELYRYVADLDLLVCGPQQWFYEAAPGDGRLPAGQGQPPVMGEGSFTLEIALPVQGKIPTALLPYFKRIPAYRCLIARYVGPREGLAGQYQKMLQHINENQLTMNGIYSESFLHIDPDDPGSQITEIRIGLS